MSTLGPDVQSAQTGRPTGRSTAEPLRGANWVLFAGIMLMLMAIPSYPFWSLAIFAIDIMIIYALAAYGGQRRPV
jgi:hypothetical protein